VKVGNSTAFVVVDSTTGGEATTSSPSRSSSWECPASPQTAEKRRQTERNTPRSNLNLDESIVNDEVEPLEETKTMESGGAFLCRRGINLRR
jgi:hypothetical protein